MHESLSDLPLSIVQVVSDEAKGILSYTKTELGAHHSPDLFHMLREIVKGVFPSLTSKIKRDQKKYDQAEQEGSNPSKVRKPPQALNFTYSCLCDSFKRLHMTLVSL